MEVVSEKAIIIVSVRPNLFSSTRTVILNSPQFVIIMHCINPLSSPPPLRAEIVLTLLSSPYYTEECSANVCWCSIHSSFMLTIYIVLAGLQLPV